MEPLIVVAALVIAAILIVWAVKVIKETVVAGLVVILILLVLTLGFGIAPRQVIEAFLNLPQTLVEAVQTWRGSGAEI